MLTGFAQIFEMLRNEPSNRLLRKRYLQLIGELSSVQQMKDHLEPLLEITPDPKEAFLIAARIRAIDPKNKHALEALASGYDAYEDYSKAAKMRSLLDTLESRPNLQQVFHVGSLNVEESSAKEPSRKLEYGFGDEEQSLKSDSNNEPLVNLPLNDSDSISEIRFEETPSSPELSLEGMFDNEDQTKILPSSDEKSAEEFQFSDEPTVNLKIDEMEPVPYAANMELEFHQLPKNTQESEGQNKENNLEKNTSEPISPLESGEVPVREPSLTDKPDASPISTDPWLESENQGSGPLLSFRKDFSKLLEHLSISVLIRKGLPETRNENNHIAKVSNEFRNVLRCILDNYLRNDSAEALEALIAITVRVENSIITDLLYRGLMGRFNEKLFSVILQRLKGEARYRKILALVYNFYDQAAPSNRELYLQEAICSSKKLGKLVIGSGKDQLSSLEEVKKSPVSASALFTNLYCSSSSKSSIDEVA